MGWFSTGGTSQFGTAPEITAGGNTAWKRGVNQGVQAVQDLTFGQNGRLEVPEYQALSQSGMDALRNAQQPGGYLGQAQQFYDQLMQGGTNPYLDAQFGKAADAVRQRLDSQFAAAGRYGSDAQKNVMADAYNDLATDIYGGQYNQDMARRMQALGLSGSLAEQSYKVPYGAAALEQAQLQQQANYPYQQGMDMVNAYLQSLGLSQDTKYAPQINKAQTMGGANQAMANVGTGVQALGTIGGLLGWGK